jgi:hypothetical protein
MLVASVLEAPKLMVTLVPGFAASNADLMTLNAFVSEVAAATVMLADCCEVSLALEQPAAMSPAAMTNVTRRRDMGGTVGRVELLVNS